MYRQSYEAYKYAMQDTYFLYVGSKYTFQEILEEEDIPFKFRLIAERYILPEASLEDTLETHLYYLDSKSFLCKIYKQLKAKVKFNILDEKKKKYVTKTLPVEEFAEMLPEEKEVKGVVIQELCIGKLAMGSF